MKVELTKAQAVQVKVFLEMLKPDLNDAGKAEVDGLVKTLKSQIAAINRRSEEEEEAERKHQKIVDHYMSLVKEKFG